MNNDHYLTFTLAHAEYVTRAVKFLTGTRIPVERGFTNHSLICADMLHAKQG